MKFGPCVLIIMASFVLTGCGQTVAEETPVLTVSVWGDYAHEEILDELVSKYLSRNPHIRVELLVSPLAPEFISETTGFIGGYEQRLLADMSTGNAPDIVYITRPRFPLYARNGAFLPLNGLIMNTQWRDLLVTHVAVDPTYAMLLHNAREMTGLDYQTIQKLEHVSRQLDLPIGLFLHGIDVTKTRPSLLTTVADVEWEDPLDAFLRVLATIEQLGNEQDRIDMVSTVFWRPDMAQLLGLTAKIRALLDQADSIARYSDEDISLSANQAQNADLIIDALVYGIPHRDPYVIWAIYAKTKHPEEAFQLLDFLANEVEEVLVPGRPAFENLGR